MGVLVSKQGKSGVPSKQGQSNDEIFEETIDTETIERHEKDKRQKDKVFDMSALGSKQEKSDVPSKQGQLIDDEIFEDTFDTEIIVFEETIDTETIERQEKDKRQAFCDQCFIDDLLNVIAFYMCVVCEKYYCKECFKRHNERNKSHMVVRVKRESGDYDGFDEFMSVVENESEKERNECLRKTNVCVCDFVDTKHGLDTSRDFPDIVGLTGYENKWWVVCNSFNACVKVFSLGSNVLQRYIRLGSRPHYVTEIIVENKTTEQDSASCSETAISGTDNKPDRKHLLAVALPDEHLILIIDLGKNPAVIHSKIKTENECFSIDSYDGNIYIACMKIPLGHQLPVDLSIMTVEGVTLKTFQTDVTSSWTPCVSVLNGNIYLTDPWNDRVVCYNDEGRVLHNIVMRGIDLKDICVDRSEDKVYISTWVNNKVYELESDLSRYKSVLDQTTRYMERLSAMCFYSDKLYVGHSVGSDFHITVVRLL